VIGRVVRLLSVALVAFVAAECSDSPTGPRRADESSAAQWKTWVLSSPSALRPAPPAADGSAQATSELAEIERLQSSRTRASDSVVAYWNALPTAHWHQQTITLLEFYWPLLPDVRLATPVRSARIFSLVNVAMYDAMVAAWDAKVAYRRRSPAEVDSKISPFVEEDATSSYPSDHAAAAAAAAALLSYLFPNDDTLKFHAMEREVGDSRIMAGAAYRSDVEAGYAIGRAVAARVIARAASDGSAAAWGLDLPV